MLNRQLRRKWRPEAVWLSWSFYHHPLQTWITLSSYKLACVSIQANPKPKARRYARPKGGHYEGRGLWIRLYRYASQPVNTLSAWLIRPLYGQCTKKGLGTINKEKTRGIERFARIEILVRQYQMLITFLFEIVCVSNYKQRLKSLEDTHREHGPCDLPSHSRGITKYHYNQ